MSQCAKFAGKQVRDCTRGAKNCLCLVEQMAELLLVIAYPRRGTDEEDMDRAQLAKMIQDNISLSTLEELK